MKKIYVVTARRWGGSETHNYVVCACLDMNNAIAFAYDHCAYRGGKYSCIVEEVCDGVLNNEDINYSKEVYRADGYTDPKISPTHTKL